MTFPDFLFTSSRKCFYSKVQQRLSNRSFGRREKAGIVFTLVPSSIEIELSHFNVISTKADGLSLGFS